MAEQNADLLKQAEELEIKVDARWGDARLQQEIDKALGNEPDPLDHDKNGKKGGAAPALHPMVVNRDFWDENGERHRKNSVIEVTAEDAIAGAETGALSRVR